MLNEASGTWLLIVLEPGFSPWDANKHEQPLQRGMQVLLMMSWMDAGIWFFV